MSLGHLIFLITIGYKYNEVIMANIINLTHYTDALRNTGYKNTESAIAEIIDNSFEANAKDILIICRIEKRNIVDIAILDNGDGMDVTTLQNSLVIGEGTRRARKGMGRFGVGLPQASLHVAPLVEVYSWQKKGDVKSVYLDINKIKTGQQVEIENPCDGEIPDYVKKYVNGYSINHREMNFENSGTLVLWRNCDRLTPKTVKPLFDRFNFLIGRKFRYFIHDNKCTIGFTVCNTKQFDDLIKPNDPLYLMKNNVVLGDRNKPEDSVDNGEPIFEHWENGETIGCIDHNVQYIDPRGNLKDSKIRITFTWAKYEFQKAGGENKIGKHLKKNVGISVVRANREIDFGKFDFFDDVNEPQHRWWGCEIKFLPELDERFGVSNNKQQVELFEVDSSDYLDDQIKPIWLELVKIIKPEIKNIYAKLKGRKKGSRSKTYELRTEEAVVTSIEDNSTVKTSSSYVSENTPKEELHDRIKKRLIEDGNPNPSDEDVESAGKPVIKIEYRDIGDNSTFIDISTRMGNCWLTINTGSIFYRQLYSQIESAGDDVRKAFNLLLMAFARAEDESFQNATLHEAFKDVREEWGKKLRKYLQSDYLA